MKMICHPKILFGAFAALAAFLLSPADSPSAALALMRNVNVGQRIPLFSLPDSGGNVFDSSSLAGHPAAIIFWSTWSPRSAEVLEAFRGYWQQYASKGLSIVAINIDGENLSSERRGQVLDYTGRMALPFPVLLDEKLRVFSSFGVVAYPSTVVIDSGGTIVYILPGYPGTLRDELHDNVLKVLGIYVEPPKPALPPPGYAPKGGAQQFVNMGRQMMEIGQMDKAGEYFDRAMERDPGFVEPVIMAARVALILKDTEKAASLMKKIKAEDINRSDVNFVLGCLLLFKDKADAAATVFRSVRDKSPREGWGWWGLSMVALARNDVLGALQGMDDARLLQEKNFEAETYVRNWLTGWWQRREKPPEEDRFLAFFPSLAETRERYRKLFGGGAEAPHP